MIELKQAHLTKFGMEKETDFVEIPETCSTCEKPFKIFRNDHTPLKIFLFWAECTSCSRKIWFNMYKSLKEYLVREN